MKPVAVIYLTIGLLSGINTGTSHAHPAIPEKFVKAGQICSGVNIHFTTGHEKDLDMIAAAGFRFIRMDFVWHNTEITQGKYNWKEYDELTANLSRRGLNAIYILDYSNPL